ncbi:LOW QUALITY PROTEIN: uncharacterized protein QC763_512140 [Podospora pseudopauciseta]|uniref:HNH nuclease domain-containing protein n=1 Tax=Podospora pseudopauciseta TaxID=2093780 RepID=A0ABR0H978_9PEZI|nr:LOW QUALITY PROTEIN: hypothetical protein QC763_512140 [Podospora pseudopauciseta]
MRQIIDHLHGNLTAQARVPSNKSQKQPPDALSDAYLSFRPFHLVITGHHRYLYISYRDNPPAGVYHKTRTIPDGQLNSTAPFLPRATRQGFWLLAKRCPAVPRVLPTLSASLDSTYTPRPDDAQTNTPCQPASPKLLEQSSQPFRPFFCVSGSRPSAPSLLAKHFDDLCHCKSDGSPTTRHLCRIALTEPPVCLIRQATPPLPPPQRRRPLHQSLTKHIKQQRETEPLLCVPRGFIFCPVFSTVPPHFNTTRAMSSPQGSPNDMNAQSYMLVPNLHVPDANTSEMDLNSHSWMMATVIEDDDLMFGGKPLSAWYEEDRRRFSSGQDEEEEPRGRQRERTESSTHHSHQHHPQQPQQHRHHGKNTKDPKQQ